MVFKCAQIDPVTGRCVSVSFLFAEVIADHIIPLSEEDNVNPGDTYDNGTWIPSPPPEPVPEGPSLTDKVAQLEIESVDTMLALAEVYETTAQQDATNEKEGIDTMLALTESYELILQQQATIEALVARVEALEGGVS